MAKAHPVIVSIALAFGGISAVSLSFIVSYLLKDGEWFQRSGSICVLFSVILEFHQAHLKNPRPSSFVFVQGRPAVFDPLVSRSDIWFHRIAWFGIIFGTIVWGYGDLVF